MTRGIYIDESGDFEKPARDRNRESQPIPARLIGGIVVSAELRAKEPEVRARMLKLGEEFYPDIQRVTEIHASDKKLTENQKRRLRESMLGFFRKHMQGAQIVAVYEVEEIEEDDPRPGAQRYRSMLLQLLRTLVFFHPTFESMESFEASVAHRRFSYPVAMDRDLAAQGYMKLKDARGLTEFTAITEGDLQSVMALQREFIPFDSKRSAGYAIRPYGQWDSPFMAMADTVCNTLNFLLVKDPKARTFPSGVEELFGKGSILFLADSAYDFPEGVLTLFHQGNPDRFLAEYLRFARARHKAYASTDRWLLNPAVIKAFKILKTDTGDPSACTNVIDVMDYFLVNKMHDSVRQIEPFILALRDRMDKVLKGPADAVWDSIAYRYYDAALRNCNHTGNVVEGRMMRDCGAAIFEKMPRKEVEQVRRHHAFLNRSSVCDTNEFAFLRSLALLKPVMEKEEALTALLESGRNETLGKIYGSMGQNHAFLGNREEADALFKKAMAHLGDHDPMQLSYRAHLALDTQNSEEYFDLIAAIFQKEGFPGFTELADESLKNVSQSPNDFNIHLLLKGMIVFPEGMEGLTETAERIYWAIQPMDRLKGRHPWELILTCLGRIFERESRYPQAIGCWRAAANFTNNPKEMTLILLGHSARGWEAVHWLKQNKEDKTRQLLGEIQETFKDLDYAPGIYNPERIKDADGVIRVGWFDSIGTRLITTEMESAGVNTMKELATTFIQRFTFNYW